MSTQPQATSSQATSSQAWSSQATSSQAYPSQATSSQARFSQATFLQATSSQARPSQAYSPQAYSSQAYSSQATSSQPRSSQATSSQATSSASPVPGDGGEWTEVTYRRGRGATQSTLQSASFTVHADKVMDASKKAAAQESVQRHYRSRPDLRGLGVTNVRIRSDKYVHQIPLFQHQQT